MLLHLDFTVHVPIYQQICNEIVRRIVTGELQPGALLPPIRTLAEDLGVNMMTVSKAYSLLKQEGYLQSDRRAGTRICSGLQQIVPPQLRRQLELTVSEAKACGMKLDEIMALCRAVYEGGAV